jgi:hypothetical protein
MATDEPLAQLAQQFEYFGNNIFRNTTAHQDSPLYAELALGAAADPTLLEQFADADTRQPFPNLLFGAAHYLLLRGAQHPLRDFFASLTSSPRPAQEAYPVFHNFCDQHAEAMRQLVVTRRVQTNEVGRCSALMPTFGLIAARMGQPLALIEIGASAGLNLLWDRYFYDYGTAGQIGVTNSSVRIVCEARGEIPLLLPDRLPVVAARLGIDLHPIDVRDDEAALWLRALVWPEHKGRAVVLEHALQVARQNPPHLIAGNLVDHLPAALSEMPTDTALIVLHSFTFNQLSDELRERATGLLVQHSHKRDLYRVCIEWYSGEECPRLELYTYQHGEVTREQLGICHSHGAWLEWQARSN